MISAIHRIFVPKELTPAMLMQKHSFFPRNHNIANAFYKAGFVESWGRGFKKITEEFEKAHLPLPTIEEDCGSVMAVMSEEMSVTVRTVERDLSIMQKAGIIRHEGADKTGTWVVLEQKK